MNDYPSITATCWILSLIAVCLVTPSVCVRVMFKRYYWSVCVCVFFNQIKK